MPPLRRPTLRRLLLVPVLALLSTAIVLFLRGELNRAFDDLGQLAMACFAGAAALSAARDSSGRLRLAWRCLAAACLSWAVGEAVWAWFEIRLDRATPFPSLADLFFLGFQVFGLAALAVFPAGVTKADRRRIALDGLAASVAFGLLSWSTALGAVVRAGGDTAFAVAVGASYPVADLGLLVGCVLVLSRSRAYRSVLGTLAAGLAVMAVSDSAFAALVAEGRYATGVWVDLGWFAAFALLALAAALPGSTTAAPATVAPTVAGALLPYVPIAGAFAYAGWRYATSAPFSSSEAVLAGLLVALVMARQSVTVRDNQHLASALAERESQMRHQAFHDGLTGLANRALFLDRTRHALELHRRDGNRAAVCFIDLDGFKAVNDTMGHAAGDQLLQVVAQRFRAQLDPADTLARLGGDEFAVLLEGERPALEVASRLLACLREPVTVGGATAEVSASIGVAGTRPDEPSPDADLLLSRADAAMYAVKRQGKRAVLLWTDVLAPDEGQEIVLARAFAQALAAGEVSLAYQPVVDLSSGRPRTLEALARWSPDGRPVAPEVFVGVAERTGLLDPLFRLVLSTACSQLRAWDDQGLADGLRIAVNLSPAQLVDVALVATVRDELERCGLQGARLVLEITETAARGEATVAREVCTALQALGVVLSLDDLGTGESSLARLRDLPLDEVKIDRSFIGGIDASESSRRFVRGVLALASEVGLDVVAEGVEQSGERDALVALGCRFAQGYLFARPLPAERVPALLAQVPWPRPAARTAPASPAAV
ncbi:MAG: hypothetical protein JWO60_1656 [Frankiales bacterium]|nr:hypothetical protein [Frankiales bacterium]